jgi:hypothetical protein
MELWENCPKKVAKALKTIAFSSPWPPVLENILDLNFNSFRVLRLSPIGFGY